MHDAMQNVMTVLSALVSLVFVLFLAYLTIKWMGRKMSLQTGGRVIKIIDRAVIGQDKCLMVVEVSGQTMLIGMAGNAVTKLADLPALPQDAEGKKEPGSPEFADVMMETLRGGWGKIRKKGDKPE